MGIAKEFKQFALKGNAVDMAVGIIMGAAFTKVVNSLVADVIMPPLGILLGGVDFKDLVVTLKAASTTPDGTPIPAVTLRYGVFVSTTLDFLIVAACMFAVVKAMNRLIRGRDGATA